MSEHPFTCPECSNVGVRYDSSVFAGELTVFLSVAFAVFVGKLTHLGTRFIETSIGA